MTRLGVIANSLHVERGEAAALRGSAPAQNGLSGQARASRTSSGNVLFASAALVAVTCCASMRAGLRTRRAPSSAVVAQALAPSGESLLPAGTLFAGFTSAGEAGGARSRIPRRMLMPKNIKWRKPHKPPVKPWDTNRWKFKGEAWRGNKPYFGKYALQILEEAWINSKNIEACRRMMVRTARRDGGKVWLRCFPHSAITWRGKETRMGGGKGVIQYWVQAVRPGYILFEMDGCSEATAKRAFSYISRYLPFKTKMLVKDNGPSRFELGLAGSLKSKKNIPKEFLKKSD
eukprot:s4386_g7.t1